MDGLTTNRDFLVRLLDSKPFLEGATDTGLLEREPGLTAPLVGDEALSIPAAAAALAAMADRREVAPVLGFAPAGFRNNFSQPQRISFLGSGDPRSPSNTRSGTVPPGSRWTVTELPGPRIHSVGADVVDLEIGGVRRRYRVRRSGGVHHVNGPDGQADLAELPRYPTGDEGFGEGALIAPMPGR